MNWRILSALTIFLAALAVITLGCDSQTAKSTAPPSTSAEETFVNGSGQMLKANNLGLTQEEIRRLEEKGIADVASAEVASRIAGFKVAVPAYVPEGFRAGRFMVQLSGGGMPEELKPKFNITQVNQYYTWSGEKYPMFLVTQSTYTFTISGSEPMEICGRPGKRTFTEADPGNGIHYDKLAFGWESNSISYAIIAVPGENLDEATLEKIACSISTN